MNWAPWAKTGRASPPTPSYTRSRGSQQRGLQGGPEGGVKGQNSILFFSADKVRALVDACFNKQTGKKEEEKMPNQQQRISENVQFQDDSIISISYLYTGYTWVSTYNNSMRGNGEGDRAIMVT